MYLQHIYDQLHAVLITLYDIIVMSYDVYMTSLSV